MDRERWMKVGPKIGEHLEAIQRIVNQNGIDQLCMASFSGNSWGLHIDDDGKHWEISVNSGGTISLEENQFRFYTKNIERLHMPGKA